MTQHTQEPSLQVSPTQQAVVMPHTNYYLAALLAGLTMLGPFAVDAYFPAFSSIEKTFHVTHFEVQQTLFAYMLMLGIMTFFHGAFSDTWGRRRVILYSLVVFGLATLGCALAPHISVLWICRGLQGCAAGAGIVVGRAMIRDCYAGPQAEKMFSLVSMIFSVAPAIAPIVGGWVVSHMQWRHIFTFLLCFTIVLALACYRYLPETLPLSKRQPFHLKTLWKSYTQVFSFPPFLILATLIGTNFAGIFIFISSAPEIITHHLGLDEQSYAWQFVPMVGGIFIGAGVANYLAGKIPIRVQMRLGLACLLLASMVTTLYHYWFPAQVPWSVLPIFVYAVGMSIVFPAATLLVMNMFSHIRGVVASCQSAWVTIIAALVGGFLSPLLHHSMLKLALAQLAFATASLILWTYYWHKIHVDADT